MVQKRLTKFVGKKEDNLIMKLKLVVHFSFARGRGEKKTYTTLALHPDQTFVVSKKTIPRKAPSWGHAKHKGPTMRMYLSLCPTLMGFIIHHKAQKRMSSQT